MEMMSLVLKGSISDKFSLCLNLFKTEERISKENFTVALTSFLMIYKNKEILKNMEEEIFLFSEQLFSGENFVDFQKVFSLCEPICQKFLISEDNKNIESELGSFSIL
jgi:hypothetical protein